MSNTAAMVLAVVVRVALWFGTCLVHVLAAYGAAGVMRHYGVEDHVAYFVLVFVIGALYGRNITAAENWALKFFK